jgi:outer membrane protein TolC
MKQLIYIIATVFISNLFAQNSVDNILAEVEKNNTSLSALRKGLDAEKIGNKTGIYIPNPEFEFHYLWGKPSQLGDRTDFSIKQSIDFPTAYSYQKQISNIRNEQVELEYQKERQDVLLQARLLCYDLIYTNALMAELSKRLAHAQSIANSYKAKFEIGEANILEYNKAQLNLLNISKELESLDIQKSTFEAQLTTLNGGIEIDFSDSAFLTPPIPEDFEEWYMLAEQNNPLLNWLKQEIEINQRQVKLNRAKSLPKLNAGYMSENVLGAKFQGLIVGVSIPLFENKNTVKYAKANSLAIESMVSNNKIQFYNRLRTLHGKAIGLQNNVEGYRSNLQQYDNSALIEKALDKGEITLIDYMLELSFYYESVNNLLELEKELNSTFAELERYM